MGMCATGYAKTTLMELYESGENVLPVLEESR